MVTARSDFVFLAVPTLVELEKVLGTLWSVPKTTPIPKVFYWLRIGHLGLTQPGDVGLIGVQSEKRYTGKIEQNRKIQSSLMQVDDLR